MANVMLLTLLQCIIYMKPSGPSWLLLIVSLPTSSATGRMRIWRAIKSLGCMALRNSACLLPWTDERRAGVAGTGRRVHP